MLILLLLLMLLLPASAQTSIDEVNYEFIVVECSVRKAESAKVPAEKRYYVSQIAAVPVSLSEAVVPQIANDFFQSAVAAPLTRAGLAVDFDMSSVKLVTEETKEDAEQARARVLESYKNKGGNIYIYDWLLNWSRGNATQTELFYRDKAQPSYEVKIQERARRPRRLSC